MHHFAVLCCIRIHTHNSVLMWHSKQRPRPYFEWNETTTTTKKRKNLKKIVNKIKLFIHIFGNGSANFRENFLQHIPNWFRFDFLKHFSKLIFLFVRLPMQDYWMHLWMTMNLGDVGRFNETFLVKMLFNAYRYNDFLGCLAMFVRNWQSMNFNSFANMRLPTV